MCTRVADATEHDDRADDAREDDQCAPHTPTLRAGEWADKALAILDRAESVRREDPELAAALVLLAEAAGRLAAAKAGNVDEYGDIADRA